MRNLIEDEMDVAPLVGAGSALGDLQVCAKRSGDPVLQSAVRRVAWQMAHAADRCAGAEASAQSLSARLDVIIGQRDEAVTALRVSGGGASAALQARIDRQGVELKRGIQAAKDAVAERDEMRAAWETLKVENQKLRSELGTLKSAKPGTPAEQPKAMKPKQPAIFDTIPPIETGPEEAAMLAARAQVVAEVDRLTALGKRRNPAQQAQLVTAQRQLAEYAPQVKAYKLARHAELMRRQSAALAEEAMKAAGIA